MPLINFLLQTLFCSGYELSLIWPEVGANGKGREIFNYTEIINEIVFVIVKLYYTIVNFILL